MSSAKNAIFIFTVVLISAVFLFLLIKDNSMQKRDLDAFKSSGTADALKRNAIETQYPEFKDFENQNSFAGKSVKYEIIEDDYYFAYMVLGSGLPIAQATCFRVDRLGNAYMIGTFPDPLDSYAGYGDINPMNCKGIKPDSTTDVQQGSCPKTSCETGTCCKSIQNAGEASAEVAGVLTFEYCSCPSDTHFLSIDRVTAGGPYNICGCNNQ